MVKPDISAEFLRVLQEKIVTIQKDSLNSVGLTQEEIAIAVGAGLIPHEQAWFYGEDWQRGEREAEEEIVSSRLLHSPAQFDNAADAISSLEE